MNKYDPVFANILVKIDPPENMQTSSLVALPDDVLEKYTRYSCVGVVLAIGPTAFSPPVGNGVPQFKVGDRVLFKQYAGVRPDKVEGSELLRVMHDTDVMAVMRE